MIAHLKFDRICLTHTVPWDVNIGMFKHINNCKPNETVSVIIRFNHYQKNSKSNLNICSFSHDKISSIKSEQVKAFFAI